MEAIREKISKNESLDQSEFFEIFAYLGLTSSGDPQIAKIEHLRKIFKGFGKDLPVPLLMYLRFNLMSQSILGYLFYDIDGIKDQVNDLIINSSWNNNFVPLSELSSIQRSR